MDGGATAGSRAKHSCTIRFLSSPGRARNSEAVAIGTVECVIVIAVKEVFVDG
jgi:hypothetical protein